MSDGFAQAKAWPRDAWPDGYDPTRSETVTFTGPRLLDAGSEYVLSVPNSGGRHYLCYWIWVICGRLVASSFHYDPADFDGNERRKQAALDGLVARVRELLAPADVPDHSPLPLPKDAAALPQETSA